MNMKSLKTQFIGAIAMVLVAAIAMGSSTYAWFAMSNTVKAEGMKVQAQAESGIVISNSTHTSWGSTAQAATSTAVKLIPSSTADCTVWKHASSSLVDNADASQAAANYTTAATITAPRAEVSTDGGSFACYKFNIKVSSGAALTIDSLDVKSVTATVDGTSAFQNLNKALRVGVVVASTNGAIGHLTGIYAPFADTAVTYTVGGTGGTSVTAETSTTVKKDTTINTIPVADDALTAWIYVWFEGEDANCKSTNIVDNLDNIKVTVDFAYSAS